MPSDMNIWIRWSRCIPIAREMPISERRSSASMAKIRKISSTPAATENEPMNRNSSTSTAPNRSAFSTASAFASFAASRWERAAAL